MPYPRTQTTWSSWLLRRPNGISHPSSIPNSLWYENDMKTKHMSSTQHNQYYDPIPMISKTIYKPKRLNVNGTFIFPTASNPNTTKILHETLVANLLGVTLLQHKVTWSFLSPSKVSWAIFIRETWGGNWSTYPFVNKDQQSINRNLLLFFVCSSISWNGFLYAATYPTETPGFVVLFFISLPIDHYARYLWNVCPDNERKPKRLVVALSYRGFVGLIQKYSIQGFLQHGSFWSSTTLTVPNLLSLHASRLS